MRNKRIYAKLAAIVLSMSLAAPTSVYAAPKAMPDGTVFDAEYYAQNNPDVKAAFGTDESLLYQHYQMFGKKEGRLPYSPDANVAFVNIGQKILSLQSALPEGTSCTNEGFKYRGTSVWPYTGAGCVAFAMLVSDAVYGTSAKVTFNYSPTVNDIQPGDIVRFNTKSGQHSVVVISADSKSITVCEGNYSKKIHWGRVIKKSSLQGSMVYIARRA